MNLIEALILLKLTGPDGQIVEINPEQIISLRSPRPTDGHFHKGTKCLIFTSDGKFTSVQETCEEIRLKLGAKE